MKTLTYWTSLSPLHTNLTCRGILSPFFPKTSKATRTTEARSPVARDPKHVLLSIAPGLVLPFNVSSVDAFIESACLSLGSAQESNQDLDSNQINAAWESAEESIHLASVLGHASAIQKAIQNAPSAATEKGGPRQWNPLTYLCFSHFLRKPIEKADFICAARLLLQGDADPNTGFYLQQDSAEPMFESVLYGAAGIAHNEALTRVLLEHGADPNDGETPYHVPEGYDNGAFRAVFESGKLNASGIATLLLRKIDFHDAAAIHWLLKQNVDPNLKGIWGKTALQSAIVRGNSLAIIRCLLEHGADPNTPGKSGNARTLAARYGRGDIIRTFESTEQELPLGVKDQLLSACATGNRAEFQRLAEKNSDVITKIKSEGGFLLSEYAGSGNCDGLLLLRELGCDINSPHGIGDVYYDITQDSTPLHVAAWRAQHDTVECLVENGADVHAVDSKGRSALHLAVEACVHSYWTEMRSDRSVAALIEAGATRQGLRFPCGYDKIDTLLTAMV